VKEVRNYLPKGRGTFEKVEVLLEELGLGKYSWREILKKILVI